VLNLEALHLMLLERGLFHSKFANLQSLVAVALAILAILVMQVLLEMVVLLAALVLLATQVILEPKAQLAILEIQAILVKVVQVVLAVMLD
jgi:hypothetical protein